MSKGPGSVERAIVAAVVDEPDNAFTVEDLCDRTFPDTNRIEKKHRVSVIRAIKTLTARGGTLDFLYAETQGRTMVLYDRCNVMSYAMARRKADFCESYRPTKRKALTRSDAAKMSQLPPSDQEDRIRARFLPGGKDHHLVIQGGAWWYHARIARARHDGEHEVAADLEKALKREVARLFSRNAESDRGGISDPQ